MNTKEINRIPIKNYLAELNILPAKDRGYYGLYHSPFREDYNASMKVDFEKNLWIDYGANIGGTLIDLVMQIEKCDVAKAISLLCEKEKFNRNGDFSFHGKNRIQNERTPAFIIQNIRDIKNPALINYLLERGINVNIAMHHCKEVSYLVNDKYYFAIGYKNDINGYELRNKYFKGCTSKAPTTNGVGNDVCKVFEGFVLDNNLKGIYNISSNKHPNKKEIYSYNSKKFGFDMPIFKNDDTFINRIIDGSKIERDGFVYKYNDVFSF
jgi:hypothetical protein